MTAKKKNVIIILRKPFGANREDLARKFDKILRLDETYPELVAPRIARELRDEGNFNLERQTWDCLMLMGYIKHLLFLEGKIVTRAERAIYDICRQIEVIYRRPEKWVCEAFDAARGSDTVRGFVQRYAEVNDEPMRQLLNVPKKYEGRNEMMYALQTFTFDTNPNIAGFDVSETVVLREMRNYIAAMECPPKDLLRYMDEDLACTV